MAPNKHLNRSTLFALTLAALLALGAVSASTAGARGVAIGNPRCPLCSVS